MSSHQRSQTLQEREQQNNDRDAKLAGEPTSGLKDCGQAQSADSAPLTQPVRNASHSETAQASARPPQSVQQSPRHVPSAPPARQAFAWALMIGIVCIAANMRSPLTSVGPLVGMIRDQLHMSNTMAGSLTTVPLLAFALFSPFAPKLARRYGMERVLWLAVIVLTAGLIVRSLSGSTALFIGTALLGIAIAACNVLIPAFIKRQFKDRIGMATGIYSVSMNLCGAIASGVSIPLAAGLGFGWQGALAVWGVLSFAAILVWLPQLKNNRPEPPQTKGNKDNRRTSLWRSPLAWQVTVFMGLQSTMFYGVLAWLPEILGQYGIGAERSGWLLSILQLAILPFSFLVPILAGRLSDQRSLVVVTALLFVTGNLGLLYGSSKLAVLWIVALGIGAGFAFSLAMMFFSLRTKTSEQAAELSGMAQSVGYLLAATAPALFGYLHDATKSWDGPLLLLATGAVVLLAVGLGAGRKRVC